MTRLPLPEPDGWAGKDYYHRPATTLSSDIIFAPEQARYTADQMHAYSDAENAALREQVRVLREALKAMLTHMGMDEDEWNKPTFDQARAALGETK